MLADPKRLFLGIKITVTDRRNRLGIRTIQALECLKSWLGLVKAEDDDIKDRDDTVERLERVDDELRG